MIIAIDFDGTCVTHTYPAIGADIGALPVLKKLIENEHKLILHTMRSAVQLDEAVEFLSIAGIELYGVNANKAQHHWTSSPKVYAHLYIDDAALGVPLIEDKDKSDRPFVDWVTVEEILTHKGILP